MHDHVDPGKRGLDRRKIRDVGLMAEDAGHRATVEAAHFVGALIEVAVEHGADEAGQAGNENDWSSHAVNLARLDRFYFFPSKNSLMFAALNLAPSTKV